MAPSSNSVQNNPNLSDANDVQRGQAQSVDVNGKDLKAKNGARSPKSPDKKTPDKPIDTRELEKLKKTKNRAGHVKDGAEIANDILDVVSIFFPPVALAAVATKAVEIIAGAVEKHAEAKLNKLSV